MPAEHECSYSGLEVSIEPVPRPDPVFWTNQAPKLKVTFDNTDESTFEWSEDSTITVTIEIDGDRVWADKIGFGPLAFGETKTVEIDTQPLSFEGHAVIGVSQTGVSKPGSDSSLATMKPGRRSSSLSPCYTSSVWDKSHYNATVRRPKRLQWATVLTSIALIFFAAVQLWVAV